jgi:NADPH-dependent ferric siderophore reductase
MLAGDETAAPAILAILESLPDDVAGDAFIEVPGCGDILEATVHPGLEVHWLPRNGRGYGAALLPAVERWAEAHLSDRGGQVAEEAPASDGILWEEPEGAPRETYAWIAGESGVVRDLRRLLVAHGVDKSDVAFMGYWRRGHAEGA